MEIVQEFDQSGMQAEANTNRMDRIRDQMDRIEHLNAKGAKSAKRQRLQLTGWTGKAGLNAKAEAVRPYPSPPHLPKNG